MEKTSAQRKFDRAMEHAATLARELRAYEASGAYVYDLEREPRGDGSALCRIFAREVQPPPGHWPLLAGEAIHNFRAALDHAVWAAWKSVPENTGDGTRTAFPITITAEHFASSAEKLRGVPTDVSAAVERAQPYSGIFAATPDMDPLAILNRLSNIDKHRTLTTVACWVSQATIGHSGGHETITDWVPGTMEQLGAGRRQIGSLVAHDDAQQNEPDLEVMYGYEVRLENVPLGYVWNFARPIFEVLWEIETGKPPGFAAPYPVLIDGQIVRQDPL